MIGKRRPSVTWSETKSSDQRWFGRSGSVIGADGPLAPASTPDVQLLFAVDAEQALMVYFIRKRRRKTCSRR